MNSASSNGTLWNPYSWNEAANIFFLDQPCVYYCFGPWYEYRLRSHYDSVGVGFSYADFGETIQTTEEAAKNIQAFISIFFETFNQFSGRPFHLSGESYAVSTFSIFRTWANGLVLWLGTLSPRVRRWDIWSEHYCQARRTTRSQSAKCYHW